VRCVVQLGCLYAKVRVLLTFVEFDMDSSRAGMMEMVLNSIPVSRILTDYGNNILAFFRANFPSETDRYKVQASVMDTYVKSCAGYCVITFLLSIGDRHLENVLLTVRASGSHG
jgi:hypothetical protein